MDHGEGITEQADPCHPWKFPIFVDPHFITTATSTLLPNINPLGTSTWVNVKTLFMPRDEENYVTRRGKTGEGQQPQTEGRCCWQHKPIVHLATYVWHKYLSNKAGTWSGPRATTRITLLLKHIANKCVCIHEQSLKQSMIPLHPEIIEMQFSCDDGQSQQWSIYIFFTLNQSQLVELKNN